MPAIASFRNSLQRFLPGDRCKRRLPQRPPGSVLFIRTDRIGDQVIFGGVLDRLRTAWPQTRIILAASPELKPLYRSCPCVDQFIELGSGREDRERIYAEVNRCAPEWIINPMVGRTMLSDRIVRYCHAKVRLGLSVSVPEAAHERSGEFDPYYTHLLRIGDYTPWFSEYEANRRLLRHLGVETADYGPRIWTSPADVDFARSVYEKNGFNPAQTVVFFCGASSHERSHSELSRYVARQARERDWFVLALGVRDDAVAHECPEPSLSSRWGNLCGQTTLQQTAEIMRLSGLVIGVDSGPMHLAWAVGARTVLCSNGEYFGRFQYRTGNLHAVCKPMACYYCRGNCIHPEPYCLTQIPYAAFERAVEGALTGGNSSAMLYISEPESGTQPQTLAPIQTLIGGELPDGFALMRV